MSVSKLDCWREAVKANGSPAETLKLAQELHVWLNVEADEGTEEVSIIPFRPARNSVAVFISELGGVSAVAAMLGKGYSTVSEMKRRQSIPIEHWPVLIRQAALRGQPIDEKTLLAAHVPHPREAAE